MTCSDAFELVEYWSNWPPEHELVAFLTRAYTSWEPASAQVTTPVQHLASLEKRWASGQAMNAKQIFDAMGGNSPPPTIGPFAVVH